MRSLFGVNPKAPAGSGALAFEELQRDMKLIIHHVGMGRWTESVTVRAVYSQDRRVALLYADGHTDTVYAGDMGLVPSPHQGWRRTYTTRA